MKIYGNKPPGKDVYLSTQKAGGAEASPEKTQVEKAGVTDRVDLSGKAKELADLKNTINQFPEVRTEKVQAIEKQVSEGTYAVDSRKVAGRMIDELV